MTRVSLQGVARRFGPVTALHQVDLTVEPGEFFTLLGPSGSGKSTLLRILAGLEAPSEGRLFFDQEEVTRRPPWQRQVAMVFQNYALYPHMSVYSNIGYPLRLRKVAERDISRRVQEVAEVLQIQHLLARRPGELSGGQQQRVALARALVHEPRLFLFDEPLSNLDARLRLEARTFLKALQRRLGITSIYVTHDQTEAMALSDRMAVLEGGRLRQVGTPREVYHHPADPFVATFVGHPPANLLAAEWRAGHLEIEGQRLPCPGQVRPGPVWLGIRPEHVSWADQGLPARVVLNEDFGHEVWVSVEVGRQRLVLRRTEALPERIQGWVGLDPEHMLVYPRDEGPVAGPPGPGAGGPG
jgi:ABC-type sugar transport system ATPase subunit